ncbi:hypothetical protein PO78_3015 [Thauera sp. SWB20]|nr:hypothetical protein PO78_3015 [Thauera sp. SWB20]
MLKGPQCQIRGRLSSTASTMAWCASGARTLGNRGPPVRTARRREAWLLWFESAAVSLCEQGSKLRRAVDHRLEQGLPVRTGVEAGVLSMSWPRVRSPCANRGRRVTTGLCLPGRQGLPVRTGVEGKGAAGSRVCPRSPCANRGRRLADGFNYRKPEVSLCEQGSKSQLSVRLAAPHGLPVRTGVEGSLASTEEKPARSPCANRGRRLGLGRLQSRAGVSLCEQGSKGDVPGVTQTGSGPPVRTGVEGQPRRCGR